MLSQHQFYVYYKKNEVFARMGNQPPVVARKCVSPAVAQEFVQSIINPQRLRPSDFQRRNEKGEIVSDLGFNDPEFQKMISPNCEEFVKAAYADAE